MREDAHYHYKTYCDELGLIADDDKKFYARLRNTPRVKDCQIRVEGKPKRVFKGISLNPNTEVEEENPNNSIADYGSVTDVTAVTAKTKSKNPESSINKECKTGVTAASSVTPEESGLRRLETNLDFKKSALGETKEIHYRLLAPNEPHTCDTYGCVTEARYKFGEVYFCDGKEVSHFKEQLKINREQGFTPVEDLPQLEDTEASQ